MPSSRSRRSEQGGDRAPAPARGEAAAADGRVGRVVAGHGRHLLVEGDDGERILCHARGRRHEGVVGDRVRWSRSGDEGVVESVEPRTSLLFRQDAWRAKDFAANIDLLLVVVAAEPTFAEAQLARALIAAHAARIDARIVLNKRDLPSFAAARARLDPYAAMGVEVVEVALKAEPEASRERLQALLAGRITLVLGPSGAGKSTLVNRMAPHAAAEVGELSQALRSGRHTTTATRWHWLDGERSAALIDSPGFQSFGLFQIEPADLDRHMPDLGGPAEACRFADCVHVAEPDCAVRAALDAGAISASRYRIYREILDELIAWRTVAHR